MRIWDLPVRVLCRKHLLGEHRELHAIWTILTEDRQGYRHHPEVKRWEGHLQHLADRHREQVEEMDQRGWNHKSPIFFERSAIDQLADLLESPPEPPGLVNTLEEQRRILIEKGCECQVKP